MKWAVGALLLLNAGLFLWATGNKGFSEDEDATRPTVNAESMRLIVETQTAATQAATETPATEKLCFRVGPFTTADAANTAGQRLYALSVPFARRNVQPREVRAYRVYLGPFATASAIDAQRKLLRANGVTDHYVRHEPDAQDVISLGLFAQKTSVDRFMLELEAKNVRAKTRTEDRVLGASYWLELRDTSANLRAAQELSAVRWNETRAKLRGFPCA